ncbi:hypothetical protein CYMTET_28514 [Cymbomonas tetramitiformis]|uniref:Uncharacterized protein n=1 Tax=Cymbomonas tetramitiformis TaxID=36881 RepID=A0AAE0FP75_9CHLO|nr:hypothetical protein CYMTET_28514 [Cymbomonas tetramitiformis]
MRAPNGVLSSSFLDYSKNLGWSNLRLSEDELRGGDGVCARELQQGRALPAFIYPEYNSKRGRDAFSRVLWRSAIAIAASAWRYDPHRALAWGRRAQLRKALHTVYINLPTELVDCASVPCELAFPRGELTAMLLLLPGAAQGAGFGLTSYPSAIAFALFCLITLHVVVVFGYTICCCLLRSKAPRACYVKVQEEDKGNESLLRTQRYEILLALWLNEGNSIWLSPANDTIVLRPNPLFLSESQKTAMAGKGVEDDAAAKAPPPPTVIMTVNGFVQRYGIFFDNLKGESVSYEEGARRCEEIRQRGEGVKRRSWINVAGWQDWKDLASVIVTLRHHQWSLYYNLLSWIITTWVSLILGVFAVPCACEAEDDQPVICTWPQTLLLVILFSIKLAFLVALQPLHHRIFKWAELSAAACNVGIVGSVQLTWWSRSFRDWVTANDDFLVSLQLISVTTQMVALLCTIVVIVAINVQVAREGWPRREHQAEEEGLEQFYLIPEEDDDDLGFTLFPMKSITNPLRMVNPLYQFTGENL